MVLQHLVCIFFRSYVTAHVYIWSRLDYAKPFNRISVIYGILYLVCFSPTSNPDLSPFLELTRFNSVSWHIPSCSSK